ncbi:hypothetical protein B0H14DRAFT_2570617 [Mycena olivaceomarginata]|nr:hypothetical protein B0H14DRAFT_2570617 [Mycena olivaceomarginata]
MRGNAPGKHPRDRQRSSGSSSSQCELATAASVVRCRNKSTSAHRTARSVTAFANAPRLTDVSLLKLSPSALADLYASYADVDDVVRVLRLALASSASSSTFSIGPRCPPSCLLPQLPRKSNRTNRTWMHPAHPPRLPRPHPARSPPGAPHPPVPRLPHPPADVRSRLSHTLSELTPALAPLPAARYSHSRPAEARAAPPRGGGSRDVLHSLALAGTEGAEAGEDVSDDGAAAGADADTDAGTEGKGETAEDEDESEAKSAAAARRLFLRDGAYAVLWTTLEARWVVRVKERRGDVLGVVVVPERATSG